jgi:uncharacterized protein (DUF885 family)
MGERLVPEVERYAAGDTTSELNVIASWVQSVRQVFDLMPTDGEEAAANIARRMAAVPQAYRQLSRTLLGAARSGRTAARLQVEEVARQCAAWAKPGESVYGGLVERLTGVPGSLRGELDAAAREATAATADLGHFLRRDLLPLAREKDACGPEAYARASRYFLGAAVDLQEAYAWSWEEIARLRDEIARVSNLIEPGATREEAVAILDADPARLIRGQGTARCPALPRSAPLCRGTAGWPWQCLLVFGHDRVPRVEKPPASRPKHTEYRTPCRALSPSVCSRHPVTETIQRCPPGPVFVTAGL